MIEEPTVEPTGAILIVTKVYSDSSNEISRTREELPSRRSLIIPSISAQEKKDAINKPSKKSK